VIPITLDIGRKRDTINVVMKSALPLREQVIYEKRLAASRASHLWKAPCRFESKL